MINIVINVTKKVAYMKKNMLVVLISHFIISLICFFSEAPIYQYQWDNGGSFVSSNKLLTYSLYVLAVLHYIFILFLYFAVGRRFLKFLNSYKSSLLSVWYLGAIFLIINIIALLCFGDDRPEDIMGIALLVYPLFIPLVSIPINEFIALFVAAVLPSLFLWFGMISKKSRIRVTAD